MLEAAIGLAGMGVDIFNNERNISSARDINKEQLAWDQARYTDQKTFAQDMMYKQFGLQTHSAREQMDFQREMSNTAYQRGMADLQKAGLNPMLAYMKGGADSPGGASANTSAPGSPSGGGPSLNVPTSSLGGALKNNLASAIEVANAEKDLKQKDANTRLTESQIGLAAADQVLKIHSAKKLGLDVNMAEMDNLVRKIGFETEKALAPESPIIKLYGPTIGTGRNMFEKTKKNIEYMQKNLP